MLGIVLFFYASLCDPMHFDPAVCGYPLLDTDVSWRIDTRFELVTVSWGKREGVDILAGGDDNGNLYLWETGSFYKHPTRWVGLGAGGEHAPRGTYLQENHPPADGDDWPTQKWMGANAPVGNRTSRQPPRRGRLSEWAHRWHA